MAVIPHSGKHIRLTIDPSLSIARITVSSFRSFKCKQLLGSNAIGKAVEISSYCVLELEVLTSRCCENPTCYFLWHTFLKTENFVRRCCGVWRYKDLMLWFSSIYPFPLLAPVMFQVTKAGQEVENDGQSIPYTACFFFFPFFQVPLFYIRKVLSISSPIPFDPKAFYPSSLIRCLFPSILACMV